MNQDDTLVEESAASHSFDGVKAKRHLRGWLSYAFASEVFVVVSLTMFLPICLEQFARDNGVLLPDKTEPCVSLKATPHARADASAIAEEMRCVVQIGWAWVDSASFSLYVYSTSVALQALTVISMGGIANHPPHRKLSLLIFAALGSVSAMLFLAIPSSSRIWLLVALCAILANVGFGASVVAMNAYLPTLAREDKSVVAAQEELHASEVEDRETINGDVGDRHSNEDSQIEPLLAYDENSEHRTPASSETQALREKYASVLSRTTARISGSGIALGYFAGIVALVLALIPVMGLKGSTFALRLAVAASGVWWALFTLPAWAWLPGADNVVQGKERKQWSLRHEVQSAWKRLGRMLRWKEIKKLKNTFRFLGAWFLLSDGFTTITSTALLFGKTSLHMSASALILVGLLVNTAGILGALMWPRLQRHLRWSNQRVLVVLVAMCSLIPAYGCLGFLPMFRDPSSDEDLITAARVGGLTTQGEMFGLAVYFGTVYGAFQGYARAFYAELIPPGEEARWYALYSITDKSSSFLGPLVVGLIADATGNIRYSFFFLVFMVWAAVPFLVCVNVEKGREDAQKYRVEERDGRGYS
ncbi:autophagy-type protein 22 [Phellopilus nigrolimitatus]|nr:autophagy-type protein 22 [Phellopilus nigrolimitatus]